MKGEQAFKRLISGQIKGPLAAVGRSGLALLSKGYEKAVAIRNDKYDRQGGVQALVPVISVGNITAGGTGKTPMVQYIGSHLLSQGHKPAVLSRGYGAKDTKTNRIISDGQELFVTPQESGDEPWLLASSLPGMGVVIGRERAVSAKIAVEQLGADVLILDDGFQHRALARDLDIVLVDAVTPFGYGHVLPRGLLREPMTSLKRADIVVLTKTSLASPKAVEAVKEQVRAIVPDMPIACTNHVPKGVQRLDDWINGCKRQPVGTDKNYKYLVATGIGQPQSFVETLERQGYTVVGTLAFGDHHAYTDEDVVRMWTDAFASGADAIFLTEKDAVKLATVEAMKDLKLPVNVLSIGIEFAEGEVEFIQLLQRVMSR